MRRLPAISEPWKAEYATNIVPEKAEFVAEVRSRNLDKLNVQGCAYAEVPAGCLRRDGSKAEIELKTNYVSFNVKMMIRSCRESLESCKRLGYQAVTAKGGGGSDARNVMALHGIKPIVLSTGMTKCITTGETLKIDIWNKCAELVLDL